MDQEASQWKFLKTQKVCPEKPLFKVQDENVFIVPDPPHLLKNIRNNWQETEIVFMDSGVRKWHCGVTLLKYTSMRRKAS